MNSNEEMKNGSEKSDRRKKLRITIVSIAAGLALLSLAALLTVNHYMSMIDFEESESEEPAPEKISVPAEYVIKTEVKPKKVTDYEETLRKDLESSAEELVFSDDVLNVLLIGTDNREKNDEESRTDAMLVLSLNKNTRQITVTSLMRDIYLTIPGAWTNRLNTAYPIGGADLLIKTLQKSFEMPVEKYVNVDFYSFAGAIDALGGIDLEVSEKEIIGMRDYYPEVNTLFGDPIDTDVVELDQAGMIHFNGKQALIYARIRNTGGGDFERTFRQRKIISAALDKVKNASLSELNDLAEKVLPAIKTNLTSGEILSLMLKAKDYLDYDVRLMRIPIDDEWWYETIEEMSVVCINMKANKKAWYDSVYLGEEIPGNY